MSKPDQTSQADDVSDQVLAIVNTIDAAIRDYPWIAIAAGMAIAGTVAFLAGNAWGSKRASRH